MKEEEYLKIIAAMLYQLDGRFELHESSLNAIQRPFGVSISDPIPGHRFIVLSLDESEADL